MIWSVIKWYANIERRLDKLLLLQNMNWCVILHRATMNACQQSGTCVQSRWENTGEGIYSRDNYATLKVTMTDNENVKDNVSVCRWQFSDCSRLVRNMKNIKIQPRLTRKQQKRDFLFAFFARKMIYCWRNLFWYHSLFSFVLCIRFQRLTLKIPLRLPTNLLFFYCFLFLFLGLCQRWNF
jgi:hypothetical protein